MIKKVDSKGSCAYYEAESVSDITDLDVGGEFLSAGCSKLIIKGAGLDLCGREILRKNIAELYSVRIQYRAIPGQLIQVPRIEDASDVVVMPCCTSFIRDLYLNKVMEFYAEWGFDVSHDRVAFSRDVAQYKLLAENSLCLAKKSVPVGLTTLYERDEPKSYCLNWIWFSAELTRTERAQAHYLTVAWLREKGQVIDAFVDSFNVKSMKFFQKIGFRPACLHITKKS